MTSPVTREEFKQYCLRKLGEPVIQVNVDDEQVEDRIDEALKFYQEYHYDATEKIYFKYQVTYKDRPDAVHHVNIVDGGTGYANGEIVTFTPTQGGGSSANGTITTDVNGTITDVSLANNGGGYSVIPTVNIATSNGVGADVAAELGGYIELPDSIIGAVNIFDISASIVSQDMFSIQYQIALNDIWSLSTYSMIPYYNVISHLSLIQQLLIGQQPIRYTRHRNRLHIDMNWDRINYPSWLIGTCYQAINPNDFPDVWGDRWLQKYSTALIKRQWGNNLKKFGNQMLPGGVVFNGQIIYDEAENEIAHLENDVIMSYSIPNEIFIG